MSTADNRHAIHVEIYKAVKKLGGGTGDILAVSNQSPEELVGALRKLGAKSDLLGIVGSWGDTQEDESVLENLRKWNGGSV
jgi:hypothetical protein